jgi:hypothetical protein
MSGVAEEIKSEISEWQKNLTARQSEIESTWKEVRALVVRYGVYETDCREVGSRLDPEVSRVWPYRQSSTRFPCLKNAVLLG